MTPLLAQGLRADRSFERIYRRHVGDVYRYALAVLRNPADAEDVTQTTFLNAYRAYAGGERPRQPQNWLIAIAHNVCRQRFRQSQRRPQEVGYDESSDAAAWLEDDERGPSAEDLRRALSHLAFNQRAALVMRELEGRSYTEIGEILGVSVAAVETLIFRARRALREQLEGTLTCAEAERALSLEADRRLPRVEKGPLRAHLRQCKTCAALARRQRAQRSAWKALGALPVPVSLTSLFGGGGAAVGVKAAAVAASAIAAGGLGLAGERHFSTHPVKAKPKSHRATPAAQAPRAGGPAGVSLQRPAVHTPAAALHRAEPAKAHAGKHAGSARADWVRGNAKGGRVEHGAPTVAEQPTAKDHPSGNSEQRGRKNGGEPARTTPVQSPPQKPKHEQARTIPAEVPAAHGKGVGRGRGATTTVTTTTTADVTLTPRDRGRRATTTVTTTTTADGTLTPRDRGRGRVKKSHD